MRRKLMDLRKSLDILADPDNEVLFYAGGICYNLGIGVGDLPSCEDTIEVFHILAVTWPYHTGDMVYPIPETCYEYPGKWEGTRGELRRHLCDFVAREIDERLDRMQKKENQKKGNV